MTGIRISGSGERHLNNFLLSWGKCLFCFCSIWDLTSPFSKHSLDKNINSLKKFYIKTNIYTVIVSSFISPPGFEDELPRIPSSVWRIPTTGGRLPASTRGISSPSRWLSTSSRWLPSCSRWLPPCSRWLSTCSRRLPPTGRRIPTPGRWLPTSSRGLSTPGGWLPRSSWRLPSPSWWIPCSAWSRRLSIHASSRWGSKKKAWQITFVRYYSFFKPIFSFRWRLGCSTRWLWSGM